MEHARGWLEGSGRRWGSCAFTSGLWRAGGEGIFPMKRIGEVLNGHGEILLGQMWESGALAAAGIAEALGGTGEVSSASLISRE